MNNLNGAKMGKYKDMWVFCELLSDGRMAPVSLEMLGEARRLIDAYNKDYSEQEKVVAVVLGHNTADICRQAISHGADLVYTCDHPELKNFRLEPYTKIITAMSLSVGEQKSYEKPRYFLFPATNNGRDLSSTVLAALKSGLASDCNKLYIKDVVITHRAKTEGGVPKKFERILHMKRPDFSGYEWSTILCLDSPNVDYHPQACSVIPGSFKPLPADASRKGEVIAFPFRLQEQDLRVVVTGSKKIEGKIDLRDYDIIVAAGRGIGRDPSRGLKLCLELAQALGAGFGISRGVVTAKYPIEAGLTQYTAEARQIGETGQIVKPKLYIAVGISGAIQHKKGMDQSERIVAVNTDPNVPIRDFCDIFIQGDLFEVIPSMLSEIKSGKKAMTA